MISPLRRCPSQDSTVALVDEVCVQENSSGNSEPVHDVFVHSWWVITKSFFDDVKRELECPFCQEQFNETRELKILNNLILSANRLWKICSINRPEENWVVWHVVKSLDVVTKTLWREIASQEEIHPLKTESDSYQKAVMHSLIFTRIYILRCSEKNWIKLFGSPGTSRQGRMLHGIWK